MSRPDDDRSVNPRRSTRRETRALDDHSSEALLAGRPVPGFDGVGEVVGLMRSAQPLQAPAPSVALAAMLADGLPASELAVAAATSWSRSTSWTRRVVQVASVGTGLLAVTVGAAAADQLPDAVQERVASVVQSVTTVQLPRPVHQPVTPPAPVTAVPSDAPDDNGQPTPGQIPTATDHNQGGATEQPDDQGSTDRGTSSGSQQGGDPVEQSGRGDGSPQPDDQPDGSSERSSGSSAGEQSTSRQGDSGRSRPERARATSSPDEQGSGDGSSTPSEQPQSSPTSEPSPDDHVTDSSDGSEQS